jgi:hypothetical protein
MNGHAGGEGVKEEQKEQRVLNHQFHLRIETARRRAPHMRTQRHS